MTFVVAQFWVWLLAALAVGVLTGVFGSQPTEHGKIAGWLRWWGLAFAAGLAVALLHILPGRPAVYLESGLAIFAVFLAGCGLTAVFSRRSLRHHEAWALGLVPAALIWQGANLLALPKLEADLKREVATLIERAGGDPLDFDVAGRDALLPIDVADRVALAKRIEAIPGVRVVAAIDELTGVAGQLREAAAAAEAAKTASSGDKAATAPKAAEPAPRKTTNATQPAPSEPVKDAPSQSAHRADKAQAAAAVLAAVPRTGDLDAAVCQSALSATLAVENIEFRSRKASIRRASANVLDKLAALLQRCPKTKVEVGAHADSIGHDEDNQQLSTRRAQRVVDYLVRMGVERDRLAAVGYGARKPTAAHDSGGENRRIELVVKQRR
ncbi:MAG: OmpA family protein [Methylocystis sp.]|nr:OmpA family protein [Methylocystis sp.]